MFKYYYMYVQVREDPYETPAYKANLRTKALKELDTLARQMKSEGNVLNIPIQEDIYYNQHTMYTSADVIKRILAGETLESDHVCIWIR